MNDEPGVFVATYVPRKIIEWPRHDREIRWTDGVHPYSSVRGAAEDTKTTLIRVSALELPELYRKGFECLDSAVQLPVEKRYKNGSNIMRNLLDVTTHVETEPVVLSSTLQNEMDLRLNRPIENLELYLGHAKVIFGFTSKENAIEVVKAFEKFFIYTGSTSPEITIYRHDTVGSHRNGDNRIWFDFEDARAITHGRRALRWLGLDEIKYITVEKKRGKRVLALK